MYFFNILELHFELVWNTMVLQVKITLYTRDIELAFKRYVRSSIMRPPTLGGFFILYYEMRNYYEYLCLFR